MSPPLRDPRRATGADGPPDILYHATTAARAERARETGVLELPRGQFVFLSASEDQAWQVAHRQSGDPVVLYIDVARARRDTCRFDVVRPGLWAVSSMPTRHILNLQPGFAEQVSAGGVLLWEGPEGPEVALIRVARRIGHTWEVAKGKMESCETPPQACLREMSEEMGFPLAQIAELEIVSALGAIRYGFQTPSGEPRLKTLHLFLVRARDRLDGFIPREVEGILEVRWFSPREAARMVHHRSLRPLMDDLCRRLEMRERWGERSP